VAHSLLRFNALRERLNSRVHSRRFEATQDDILKVINVDRSTLDRLIDNLLKEFEAKKPSEVINGHSIILETKDTAEFIPSLEYRRLRNLLWLELISKIVERRLPPIHYFTLFRLRKGIPESIQVPCVRYIRNLLEVLGEITQSEEKSIKAHIVEEWLLEHKVIRGLERFDFEDLVFRGEEDLYPVPLEHMGDGFKALVALVATLDPGDIVLLEEPELHMHPGYIRELLEYLVSFSMDTHTQFFIVTHSRDVVGCLLDDQTLSEKNTGFLEKEFNLTRLTSVNTQTMSDTNNDEEAQSALNGLLLDLRGI
jgi:hypothetical protein